MCKQFSAQSDVMRLLYTCVCALRQMAFLFPGAEKSTRSGVFPKHNVNILYFNCCLEGEKNKRPCRSLCKPRHTRKICMETYWRWECLQIGLYDLISENESDVNHLQQGGMHKHKLISKPCSPVQKMRNFDNAIKNCESSNLNFGGYAFANILIWFQHS
jgi:hypothetical protein